MFLVFYVHHFRKRDYREWSVVHNLLRAVQLECENFSYYKNDLVLHIFTTFYIASTSYIIFEGRDLRNELQRTYICIRTMNFYLSKKDVSTEIIFT